MSTATPATIRPVAPADWPAWQALWRAYTQKVPLATVRHSFDSLFAPHTLMQALVAEVAATPVGFCLFHRQQSSWRIAPEMYAEDLFVAASHRGQGIARQLAEATIAHARRTGIGRIHWITGTENAEAQKMYNTFATRQPYLLYELVLE